MSAESTTVGRSAGSRPTVGEPTGDQGAGSRRTGRDARVVPSDGLVHRRRLLDRLDHGTTGGVTLVSAPAGWGKTTLLTDWCRTRAGGGDPDDTDDPVRITVGPGGTGADLWSSVRAALTRHPVPPTEAAVAVPDQRLLHQLLDALADRSAPVLLVVDDLHLVADPDALDGLDFLLRHADGRLALVAGGRRDPALALHRWRLADALTEVRAADLAFTVEETAELLRAHDVVLDPDHTAELCARTEGWPVGLRLAALALRGRPDPARFVRGYGGDHPDVAGYLDREVLDGLPDGLRDAWRRTAVVTPAGGVPGSLVDALTDRDDGENLLAELADRTGFLSMVDSRPASYRCHRMLAELLRAELRRRSPEETADLHRRAAIWYVAHGQPAAALRHALAGRRWRQAVEVLVGHWPRLVTGAGTDPAPGDDGPAEPPVELFDVDPELVLAGAAERLSAGDSRAAARRLDAADRYADRLTGPRRRRYAVVTAALRLGHARLAGTPDAVRDTAEALIALGAREPARSTGFAAGDVAGADDPTGPDGSAALAVGYAARGAVRLAESALDPDDLSAAVADLDTGWTYADLAGLPTVALACTARRALVAAVRGELRAAESAARTVAAVPSCEPAAPVDCAYAHLALAVVAGHRDRPDEVRAHLARTVGPGSTVDEPVLTALSALVGARLSRDVGDPAGAEAVLAEARRRLPDRSVRLAVWLTGAGAELRAAHGDVDGARTLLASAPPAALPAHPPPPLALAAAATALAAGDPRTAARELPGWDPPATDLPLPLVLRAGLLDAATARLTGDPRRASRTVERVLALAEPEGFRRVFTRAEPAVREALAAHLDSGTAYWTFLSDLLGAVERPPAPPPLAEPLTERELTVLRYLQSILSNVEIATELSLSVNTVKTHVRNIYRKLDATRRRDAVRRARELHLI